MASDLSIPLRTSPTAETLEQHLVGQFWIGPELHRALREIYREAMQEWRTQDEAFNEALRVLVVHFTGTREEARRLLARMLTQEPPEARVRRDTAADRLRTRAGLRPPRTTPA